MQVILTVLLTQHGQPGGCLEEHNQCGLVLEEDVVVCLWNVQVLVEGQEENAIAGVLGDH